MKQYCYYESPIGKLLLVGADSYLENLYFPNKINSISLSENFEEDNSSFQQITTQLTEFFSGKRKNFQLQLRPQGTDFQLQVWRELQKVPYGKTASYGEIAARIGNPKACRAVGMANSKNPIPIIIPCHRIIGKNGSLTGFGGGLDVKKQLLGLEQQNNQAACPG